MAAVEKWTCFGERQLFSERTQFLKILALELEFRFQPVSDGRHHGPKFSKMKVGNGGPPISVAPRLQSSMTDSFRVTQCYASH